MIFLHDGGLHSQHGSLNRTLNPDYTVTSMFDLRSLGYICQLIGIGFTNTLYPATYIQLATGHLKFTMKLDSNLWTHSLH